MTTPLTNPLGRAPAAAVAYVRSILDLLGDRDPLEVQSHTAQSLRAAIKGLPEKALATPERPGKWSIAQVCHHLADSEIVYGWRLRLVLSQERPAITGYDQDAWTARVGGAYRDAAHAIDIFALLRDSHILLQRSLTPAQWEHVGMHSERGPESVRLMAKLYAGHDLAHLKQIARIRQAIA